MYSLDLVNLAGQEVTLAVTLLHVSKPRDQQTSFIQVKSFSAKNESCIEHVATCFCVPKIQILNNLLLLIQFHHMKKTCFLNIWYYSHFTYYSFLATKLTFWVISRKSFPRKSSGLLPDETGRPR